MPDKSLAFKNEQLNDGKYLKKRLTLLLAVNMTGMDNEKHLLIEKSRCVQFFMVKYILNNKSWITSDLTVECSYEFIFK